MASSIIERTKIKGLFRVSSETKGDSRGSFREVVRFPNIEEEIGYHFDTKQVNHSSSIFGTLRGLHVEPWSKLVTVISGLAVCVFLDTRPESDTFGKTEIMYLGSGKTPEGEILTNSSIFIEEGIANSFLVISERLEYVYLVNDIWTPATATYAINPMDRKLNIPWNKYVSEDKIIRSDRDMKSGSFEEFCKQRG